jgi:hypothetical protein
MAVAIIVAILWQIRALASTDALVPVNFFSFFTIDSNIIAALTLVWSAGIDKPSARLNAWRGAATVYLATTGVVYALLLSNNTGQEDSTINWVNVVLHQISPVVMVLDWLFNVPKQHMSFKLVLAWIAFPVIWLVYTLIRGPHAAWYPYPFLDPTTHITLTNSNGYTQVAGYCLGIAAFITLECIVVIAAANALRPTTSSE